jgi:hypothetical protein
VPRAAPQKNRGIDPLLQQSHFTYSNVWTVSTPNPRKQPANTSAPSREPDFDPLGPSDRMRAAAAFVGGHSSYVPPRPPTNKPGGGGKKPGGSRGT